MDGFLTVDAALKRGRWLLRYMPGVILFLPMFLMLWLGVFGPIAIGLSLLFAWIYSSFAVIHWKLWAFEGVRNVHELHQRAVEEDLIRTKGLWYETTAIWTRNQKQKWEELQQKFLVKDVFVDDPTVPNEVQIGYSKLAGCFNIVLGIVFISCFIFSLNNQFGKHTFIGLLMLALGVHMIYEGITHLKITAPQIIMSNKGIKLSHTGFSSWHEVTDEKVETRGSGKTQRAYLTYFHHGSPEEMKIDDLNTDYPELSRYLRVYRGRYEHKKAMRQG